MCYNNNPINNLVLKANKMGYNITEDDIILDTSRGWSLYINGHKIDQPVYKFGAYRNYLGGGVRGALEHNGNTDHGTYELGQLFADTLSAIEDIINEETKDLEIWEQNTGVLL